MANTAVKIVEVGPRDGLQNIKDVIPTHIKTELIKRLSQTGLRTIEASSFVSPRWVPQLSDVREVLQTISPFIIQGQISYPVLVPNLKGLDGAIQSGVKEIGVFLSATEGFSRKNINCTVEESIERARKVIERALQQNIRVRAYVSCIVECPYDGPTPPAKVLDIVKKLLQLGCFEVSLGDTTGAGTPHDIRRLLEVLLREVPASQLAGHFHDTFGQAVANVMTAYEMGITTFDSSVSGLGGCPYSPGAKGNLATEDVVYAFNQMGVHTGIDLAKLSRVGDWISRQLGIANGSRAGTALVAREVQSREPASTPLKEEWLLTEDAGDILLHRRGSAVRITLNRPKNGNALTSSMVTGLTRIVRKLSEDQTCFRIVLTAAGKYFCTGMDLKNATKESRRQDFEQLRELFDTIDAAPQTSIALVNGPSFGGGVGLAFACDIRLASEGAVFQLTEVRLGICPAVISKFVFREWGISFAREAMLSARPVPARELLEKVGAIHMIITTGKSDSVDKYLDDLKSCAPGGSKHVKTLARAAWELQGQAEQAHVIEKTFDTMMSSEEQRIGTAAFAKGVRRTDWEDVLLSKKAAKL